MGYMPEPLPPVILTDRVRALSAGVLSRLGLMLHRARVHPDTLTILGLVVVAFAAVVIASGQFQAGAIILLVGLPLDALDGAVARAMERTDLFGAVLDSALDRYADAFIFAGLGYHFAVQDRFDLLLLTFAALMGSASVSYIRARAEGVGVSVKVGWFSRLERVVVILVMLLIPNLLTLGLVILAVGTNLTSAQRLWVVYKALKQKV
jgi:CDP-diacylglycerol--glycerol-3-phosphate 3-phosphatidyltransferase